MRRFLLVLGVLALAGSSLMAYSVNGGSSVTASYVAKAKFQAGEATINLALVRRDGRRMINGFHVDTPLAAAPAQRS